jgi:putative ABC transport system ATP-binding protein
MKRLEAVHLVKRYGSGNGSIAAVDGVSLSLGAGESLAVTGASGSGKSTLLSLLAALERPDKGKVLVEGRDLGPLDEAALAAFRGRKLGIVFQSFRLLPHLSALENVRVPLDLAGKVLSRDKGSPHLDLVGNLGLRAVR